MKNTKQFRIEVWLKGGTPAQLETHEIALHMFLNAWVSHVNKSHRRNQAHIEIGRLPVPPEFNVIDKRKH